MNRLHLILLLLVAAALQPAVSQAAAQCPASSSSDFTGTVTKIEWDDAKPHTYNDDYSRTVTITVGKKKFQTVLNKKAEEEWRPVIESWEGKVVTAQVDGRGCFQWKVKLAFPGPEQEAKERRFSHVLANPKLR